LNKVPNKRLAGVPMPGITMAETLGIFEQSLDRPGAQVARPHSYSNVHVLAMQWEFPDSKNYTTNFDYMCMVFEKYGWNVHKKAIPTFTDLGIFAGSFKSLQKT